MWRVAHCSACRACSGPRPTTTVARRTPRPTTPVHAGGGGRRGRTGAPAASSSVIDGPFPAEVVHVSWCGLGGDVGSERHWQLHRLGSGFSRAVGRDGERERDRSHAASRETEKERVSRSKSRPTARRFEVWREDRSTLPIRSRQPNCTLRRCTRAHAGHTGCALDGRLRVVWVD